MAMDEFSAYSSLKEGTQLKIKFEAWPIRVSSHLALTDFHLCTIRDYRTRVNSGIWLCAVHDTL